MEGGEGGFRKEAHVGLVAVVHVGLVPIFQAVGATTGGGGGGAVGCGLGIVIHDGGVGGGTVGFVKGVNIHVGLVGAAGGGAVGVGFVRRTHVGVVWGGDAGMGGRGLKIVQVGVGGDATSGVGAGITGDGLGTTGGLGSTGTTEPGQNPGGDADISHIPACMNAAAVFNLAYTAGTGPPHCSPKDTTPMSVPSMARRGPPESLKQESVTPPPAHTCTLLSKFPL